MLLGPGPQARHWHQIVSPAQRVTIGKKAQGSGREMAARPFRVKRTLCRRGYFPSLESSPPAGGTSPCHRFRTCPGGPVWDRPLRRGIKPGRRADDIRPYESPRPGILRAHTVRPYEKRAASGRPATFIFPLQNTVLGFLFLLFLQVVQRNPNRFYHKSGKSTVRPLNFLFNGLNHIIGEPDTLCSCRRNTGQPELSHIHHKIKYSNAKAIRMQHKCSAENRLLRVIL